MKEKKYCQTLLFLSKPFFILFLFPFLFLCLLTSEYIFGDFWSFIPTAPATI